MIERMVLFGASGYLTGRLLMPAIAQLAEAGLLPPGFTVAGSANTDWSTDDFRHHIAAELEKHSAVPSATRDAVVRMLTFQAADVTRAQDVSRLFGADHPNTLVYLALPPFLLESVLPALADAGLGAQDAVSIEKPFGTDLASARHLNVRLSTTLNGPERTAEIRQLEARSTPPRFTAYAHLLLEMLRGDPMLFIRGDEAEESWRVIDP
jgi:glucose-6-phosphate 1-dehydrogenase